MVSTKHFVHDPDKLVASAISAIPIANPSLAVDVENKIIYRKVAESEKVSVISGGGAGHEPSFASYVGKGILNAAVSGSIFASPSSSQILTALTSKVASNKGILQVIMNYTGDALNFGLGSEKAKAAGKQVETVIVGDDVGVGRQKSGKVGRRGIAGTVLVHKIVGAAADSGFTLKQCRDLAQLVARNIVSVGCSLSHVHVPGSEPVTETLEEDQIEIGMGIHNEQGSERVKTPDLPLLVEKLLKQLLDPNDKDRAFLGQLRPEDEWVLLLNNLGGVSPLEMGAILNEVVSALGSNYSIKPKRVYSGTFMTSLNGLGFSISLLRIEAIPFKSDTSFIDLLDYPHETIGWTGPQARFWDTTSTQNNFSTEAVAAERIEASGLNFNKTAFKESVSAGLQAVISAEAQITKYDDVVGDGDCGTTFKRGAEAVLSFLQDDRLPDDPVVAMTEIANTVEKAMGGTSGAIFSIFLTGFAEGLREIQPGAGKSVGMKEWCDAASYALKTLYSYTPARPGDRTLVDAFHPFIDTVSQTGDVQDAAKKAMQGAESTATMAAKLGRSTYVRDLENTPDPGAVGVATFFEGFAKTF
ncbi:dihydroxyacetone kinase [Ascobolus immersus RN42]|uniref:Dihydroxyacetone kinase n=1 Tax=Ascobolus immersus RN42 TaxID=1160509 RepID=A0A3N4I323_ASCIM|nr:dihydroxyacetone kinase [Ascobolus immersus RN42]